MATVPNDADEIRRQMATIRRELHKDVRDVVTTAHAATDWVQYLKAYPWLTLGAAFAAGYLVIPRRHKTAQALAETQADLNRVRKVVEATDRAVTESAKVKADEVSTSRGQGLVGAVFGMVTPLVFRAAQGYALKYLEQWIMNQQHATLHSGPESDQSHRGPGRAGGPGSQGQGGAGRPVGPRSPFGPDAI